MSQDARWYLQRDGKAVGPFSLSDLKDQVQRGALQGHDLVFQDGSAEWKRVFDCPDLATEIFAEQRTSFTGLFVLPPAEGEGWVVLVRRQDGTSLRFDQQGPMTTENVRGLLRSGGAKPTDHVWKKGFDQWVAIATLSEFSPATLEPAEPVAKPTEPLAGPVAKEKFEFPPENSLTRFHVNKVEVALPAKPPEEFTSSLQILSVASATEAVSAKPSSAPKPEPVAPSPAGSAEPPMPREPLRMGGREWFLISVLVVAVFGAFTTIKRKMAAREFALSQAEVPAPQDLVEGSQDQASTSTASTEPAATFESAPAVAPALDLPPAETGAPVAAKPATQAPSAVAPGAPTSAVTAKKAVTKPTPVAVAPKTPDRNVTWSFAPAADPGSSLLVLITGFSGQVLDVNAVNLKQHLFLPSNRKLLLEPRALHLPEGDYLVQIFQGGRLLARSEQRYVTDEDKFEKQLWQHRKQIAYEQQVEKRNLLRALDGLQRFVSANQSALSGKSPLSPKARASLQRSLEALNRPELKKLKQSHHALMYPGGWSSFAAQYENARALTEKAGSRNPAGRPDLDALKKKIDQARTQVSRTSLWSKKE